MQLESKIFKQMTTPVQQSVEIFSWLRFSKRSGEIRFPIQCLPIKLQYPKSAGTLGEIGAIGGKTLKLHLQHQLFMLDVWPCSPGGSKGTAFGNTSPYSGRSDVKTEVLADASAVTWVNLQFPHFQANDINPAWAVSSKWGEIPNPWIIIIILI